MRSWCAVVLWGCAKTAAPQPLPVPSELFMVDSVHGLGLRQAERPEAEAMVAAWASTQGMRVLPVDQVYGDPAPLCGRPMWRNAWDHGVREEHGVGAILRAKVRCDDACVLIVHHGETRLAAPYDPERPWQQSLPDALASLAPAPLAPAPPVGPMLGMSAGVRRTEASFDLSLRAVEAWTTHANQPPKDPGDADAVQACMVEGRVDTLQLLAAYDDAGERTWCEGLNVTTDAHRCACDALSLQVPHAMRGARVWVDATYRPEPTLTPSGLEVSAVAHRLLEPGPSTRVSDPRIAAWRTPESWALRTCFEDHEGQESLSLYARLTFDDRGMVQAIDTTPKGMSPAEVACVVEHLRASRAPCVSGQPTADVNIITEFTEIP